MNQAESHDKLPELSEDEFKAVKQAFNLCYVCIGDQLDYYVKNHLLNAGTHLIVGDKEATEFIEKLKDKINNK